jgi:hypothetical protein
VHPCLFVSELSFDDFSPFFFELYEEPLWRFYVLRSELYFFLFSNNSI